MLLPQQHLGASYLARQSAKSKLALESREPIENTATSSIEWFMAKAPAAITSPIKKLAAKALKSPSMLTTEETRELGASVMARLACADLGGRFAGEVVAG